MYKPNYYMIVNKGTMINSARVQRYPYHLVLAQMCLKSPELVEAIKNIRRRNADARIILDNGAHEGELVGHNDYRDVIEWIRPDVVVLPDLIGGPSVESRYASVDFGAWVEARFPMMQMMYAAQGATEQQIIDEYVWAYDTLDPAKFIIGYGQSYLTFERDEVGDGERRHEDARQYLMMKVITRMSELRRPLPTKVRSHILGARWEARDYSSFVRPLNITGLDTIKPCTCALQHTLYPIRVGNEKVDRMSDRNAEMLGGLFTNIDHLADAYGLQRREVHT